MADPTSKQIEDVIRAVAFADEQRYCDHASEQLRLHPHWFSWYREVTFCLNCKHYVDLLNYQCTCYGLKRFGPDRSAAYVLLNIGLRKKTSEGSIDPWTCLIRQCLKHSEHVNFHRNEVFENRTSSPFIELKNKLNKKCARGTLYSTLSASSQAKVDKLLSDIDNGKEYRNGQLWTDEMKKEEEDRARLQKIDQKTFKETETQTNFDINEIMTYKTFDELKHNLKLVFPTSDISWKDMWAVWEKSPAGQSNKRALTDRSNIDPAPQPAKQQKPTEMAIKQEND